jgi:hypothetical protein
MIILPRQARDRHRESTQKERYDHRVDRDEVAKAGTTLGQTLSTEELDAAMAEMDKDDDGSVDFEEFIAYFHTGGKLTFGTLPPKQTTTTQQVVSGGGGATAVEVEEGHDDADAADRLGKALVTARESLWQRRRDHRVGLRRTLQRWLTARTAKFLAIARQALSAFQLQGLSDESAEEVLRLVQRYTASRHLTRNAVLGEASSAIDGLNGSGLGGGADNDGSGDGLEGGQQQQVEDMDELRRQQEAALEALRTSQEAERASHAEQLKQMESQLSELAKQAAAAMAQDAPDDGTSDIEAGGAAAAAAAAAAAQAAQEVQAAEEEIVEVAATQTEEVNAAKNALEADLQRQLAAAESEEQRRKMMAQYEDEKCQLLKKMGSDQAIQRARLQSKLQAKKKAAAAAAAERTRRAAAAAAAAAATAAAQLAPVETVGGLPGAQSGGVLSGGSFRDEQYGDVAKSIVADYTNQMVRTLAAAS